MEDNKMKNIVVLKNLPSNLVEEAIVVLKGNKVKLPEHMDKKQETGAKAGTKDYILKEAEMVISNYLSNVENKKIGSTKKNKGIEKKYRRLQVVTIGLLIALAMIIIF